MTTPHPATDATRRGTGGTAFVLGGGAVGRDVAVRLAADGETVTLVDRSPPTDPPPGQAVYATDSLDTHALREAGLGDATAALVLEPDDATNLLVAQLARTRFDVDRVLVRTNDPGRASAFERLGVETVDATAALARTVAGRW